jgi:hypothetical protein
MGGNLGLLVWQDGRVDDSSGPLFPKQRDDGRAGRIDGLALRTAV